MSVDAPNGLKARRARLILAAVVIAVAALLVAGGFTAATLMRDDTKGQPQAAASPSVGAPASASTGTSGPMTPEKGKKTTLRKPTGQKDGVSTGFPGTPQRRDLRRRLLLGGIRLARRREGPPAAHGRRVQGLTRLCRQAGLRDPQDARSSRPSPSGGISADINFTTAVNATRATTVHAPGLPVGDVMQVWVSYDRFGTGPKGGRDENPLRGDMVDFIVKWQDGAWRFTDEFDSLRSFPVAYEPTSRFAWNDGWVQVRHVD
ncbi:hypothetical protein GCM10020254_83430 [Streptomyces goshikiensis]